MIRLQNNLLGMMLHAALYDRLLRFIEVYTPEGMGSGIVSIWLNRFYQGDPTLHILVDLDESYKITAHAVLEIQDNFGVRVASLHQAEGPTKSPAALAEALEYLEKLAAEAGASYIVAYVAKGNKALETKYGFSTVRTVLMKGVGDGTTE